MITPLGLACIILLVLVLVGGFHPSLVANYGYYPGGGLSLLLIILIILIATGRL